MARSAWRRFQPGLPAIWAKGGILAAVLAKLFLGAAVVASLAAAPRLRTIQEAPPGYELLKKIFVAGNTPWTDTGLEVRKDQEFYFQAEGTVSLQKDNPVAECGPDGLAMKTMRQPVAEQNLGGLIGKVREKIEIIEDKQSGEKTQRELGEVFFIGKEGRVMLPSAGRLLLGVNDNLTGDNDGGFEVWIYAKKIRPSSRPA